MFRYAADFRLYLHTVALTRLKIRQDVRIRHILLTLGTGKRIVAIILKKKKRKNESVEEY